MKQQSSSYLNRGSKGGYKILLLLLCATALVSFSANKPFSDFSGKWHAEVSSASFDLKLNQIKGMVSGSPCAIQLGGSKVDCVLKDNDVTITGAAYNNTDSLFNVFKIDSINAYYLIYAKKDKSIYKIVSKKETIIGSIKIEPRNRYYFKLYSIISNRKVASTSILPQNSLLVNCYSFDDTTQICLENGQLRELYLVENLKGLFLIETEKKKNKERHK
jgi:hypothetical protein